MTKKCARCEKELCVSNFAADKRAKNGLKSWCKPCVREYKKLPRQVRLTKKAKKNARDRNLEKYRLVERSRSYKQKFGITLEEYNQMFEAQEGRCAICQKHQSEVKRQLCVDHNHETGKIRSLLCNLCNVGLGHFTDNETLVLRAYEYLIRHRN